MSKPALWMGYSLDGLDNVTVTGNTTLAGLSSGLHNVTVYAKDTFENGAASETVAFNFAVSEPFPLVPVAALVALVATAAGIGLLLQYRKKRNGSSGI